MDDDDRIVATADTPAGNPRIKGTRIAVDPIAGWPTAGASSKFLSLTRTSPARTSSPCKVLHLNARTP